jgi:hypothetical protein
MAGSIHYMGCLRITIDPYFDIRSHAFSSTNTLSFSFQNAPGLLLHIIQCNNTLMASSIDYMGGLRVSEMYIGSANPSYIYEYELRSPTLNPNLSSMAITEFSFNYLRKKKTNLWREHRASNHKPRHLEPSALSLSYRVSLGEEYSRCRPQQFSTAHRLLVKCSV